MPRKLVLFVLLALSLSVFARTRAVSPAHHDPARGDGATISGIVTSVQGNLIRVADGLIAIDASGAKIVVGRGREAAVADIEPGMLVFATLRDVTTRSDGPLLATLIVATPASDVTMTGVVENVDLANRKLTLLRQFVYVDNDTSFGGFRNGGATGLEGIQQNQIVKVEADVVNGRLVAREVLVLAPVIPEVGRLRGTVVSIGTESWVVRKDNSNDNVTLVVDARTRIAGSPKVGDKVEVLYRVDSAHAFVAVAIVKFETPPPPPQIVRIHGRVQSIAGAEWTVRENNGADRKFTVTSRTQVMPGIVVGDLVEVLAIRKDDGTHEAVAILRLRF